MKTIRLSLAAIALAGLLNGYALAADKPASTQPANQSAMAQLQQCMDQLKQCKDLVNQAYSAQSSGKSDQVSDLLSKAKASMDQCMNSMSSLKSSYGPQLSNAMKAVGGSGLLSKFGMQGGESPKPAMEGGEKNASGAAQH